jgi:hypothetical protein
MGGARLAAGAVLGGLALIAVHLALAGTYWNSEEGVYALTARLLLSGHELYRQTAAAQPPVVFLVGAGLLAIHDGLEWLRLGVAGFQLGAGLLAAQIVWRTTGSLIGSIVAVPATLLTPWAVHEHGSLTPELISLPFLLGALLASRRERTIPVAGMLCGLLPLIKLPDVLPAVVIILCATNIRRTALWAAGTFLIALAATLLLGGDAFWRDVVVAQSQSQLRPVGLVKGWWLQAAWTLSGLVVCSLLAFWLRRTATDQGMLRAVLMTSLATSVTLVSVLKTGTGLNVTVPVEAVLVPGALSGAVLTWRLARRDRGRWLWVATAISALAILTLAQSLSLILSPSDPEPFLRPGSAQVGWAEAASKSQLRSAVNAARACPKGSVFGGPPLIAFAADRRMPADQPDAFITALPALRSVREQMDRAPDVCR